MYLVSTKPSFSSLYSFYENIPCCKQKAQNHLYTTASSDEL
jgi:hypothetical protein